jgi:hypothetical protein
MQHKGFSILDESEPLSISSLFLVLYGLPGVGKTSLSFTMPGKVLHLDPDKGLRRAVQKVRPKSAQISEYGAFYDWIMSNHFAEYIETNGIKSLVIDTAGALLDDLVAPYLIRRDSKNGNATGGLSLPGWGSMKINFNALKSRLQSMGLHVCCLAHAKEEGESNNRRFELAVSGGSADIIYRSADLIGFVSIQPDGGRAINFNPTAQNIGKNVGNIPMLRVPDAETEKYDTFLSDVIDGVLSKMTEQSAAQIELQKRIDEWRDVLESAKTPADLNGVTKSAAELADGVLKQYVKKLLFDAVEQAGYSWDKGKVVKTKVEPETVTADETN